MPPKKPPKAEATEGGDPNALTPAQTEEYLKFADVVQSDLNTNILQALVEVSEESKTVCLQKSEFLFVKTEQLKADQAEANTYLQNKLTDNYAVIAEMEDKIISEQHERRESEIDLIKTLDFDIARNRVEREVRAFELKEKESSYVSLSVFSENQMDIKERLKIAQTDLEQQKINHITSRQQLVERNRLELIDLVEDFNRKLNTTKENLSFLASTNLAVPTRRLLMEGEKMKNELVYQSVEVKKIKNEKDRERKRGGVLKLESKEARKMEDDSAKKR